MPNRKISRGPPELLNIIFEVADRFHMKNVEHIITFGCDDVDDYHNGIYNVRIKGQKNGQKVKKSFIIKWHNDPKKRMAFREAYQRECFFFCHIVPKLLELQSAFKVIEGLKIKFANCALATAERGKESIVLSNFLREGFMFHDRFHKLDLDHVALAVKNLAKLHALSFVLEKSQPGEFEKIKQSCYTDVQYSDTERMSDCIISFYNTSVEVVADCTIKKKLQDCASDVLKILNMCVMPDTSCCTICHGDYWNNNIIFKYCRKRPVDVMFIDTQLVRYASPVTDISYYLYMSTDHEFRSKYYDRVLALYYGTLSAVIRQCNLDIELIYPESVFRQQLKKYSVYGLMEALISMKIITAIPEDAIKMTEAKNEFCADELCNELQNRSMFVERVNGVVEDFFARGYSLDAVLKS